VATPTSTKILEHLEDRLLLQIVMCFLDRGAAIAPLSRYESTEAGFSEVRIAELHAHDWSDAADAVEGDRFRRAVLGLVERELITRVVVEPDSSSGGAERIGALVRPTRAGLKRADYLEASRADRSRLWWADHWHEVAIPALVSLVVSALTVTALR